MEAEAGDAVAAGQGCLLLEDGGIGEVVEAERAGEAGLVVALEAGEGLGDVGPFGEAGAPPAVVFGNGVELGKVEGDKSEGGVGRRVGAGPVRLVVRAGCGVGGVLVKQACGGHWRLVWLGMVVPRSDEVWQTRGPSDIKC